MTQIEHPFGTMMSGEIAAEVLDPQGLAPPAIVQHDHPFVIQVKWQIQGGMALYLSGKWRIRAFVNGLSTPDRMMVADEIVDVESVPIDLSTMTREYPPLDLQVDSFQNLGLPEGAYKVVTLLNYKTNGGTPGEIAGFVEGPVIDVYVG